MSNQPDRCPFCQGDLDRKTITYPTEREGRVVVIDNVPAFVCRQCGEIALEPEVVERLQQIAWGEVAGKQTLEVDSYDFAQVA